MIKSTAIVCIIWTVFLTGVSFLAMGEGSALSTVIGGALATANLVLLALIWKVIFNKKNIALMALVIIFKYLIFGVILILISRQSWIDPMGFVLGMSTLVLAILTSTWLNLYSQKK